MPDPDNPEPASQGGRATVLWVSAILLCLAATAIMLLSSDVRLLRLGLVAALWAALVAGFAVAKLRNRIADDDDRADQLQRIYELELEREVAARREFELEAEHDARQRAADESKAEIEALRSELQHLRQSLEQIVGGDVLFERVALRAESTRLRALAESGHQQPPEANRVIQPQQWGRELPSAQHPEGGTELIDRISGEQYRPQPQKNTRPPQPPQNRPGRDRPQYVRPAGHTPPKAVRQPPEQPAYERVLPPPAVVSGPEQPVEPEPAPPYPPGTSQQDTGGWQQEAAAPPPAGPPARARAPMRNPAEVEQAPSDEVAEPEPEAPRRAASQAVAGAHTEGTSVRELLATYSKDATGTRSSRRRRE